MLCILTVAQDTEMRGNLIYAGGRSGNPTLWKIEVFVLNKRTEISSGDQSCHGAAKNQHFGHIANL
jgi:hypothetical protein